MKPIAYLAIDPGDVSGYATFDAEGNLLGYGQVSEAEFYTWLETELTEDLTAVIIEDYVNFGHMQQKRWSKNKTSKKIGSTESIAHLRNVPVVHQTPGNRDIGYMWSGQEQPKNHKISHQFDAYAHGVYYLQKNEIRKPGQGLKEQA